MGSRLILIALALISASPPHKADYQRCVMIHTVPLDSHARPIASNAPVSGMT